MSNAMVDNTENLNVPRNATGAPLLAPRWGGDKPAYMNSPTGNSPNIPQPGAPASNVQRSPNYGSASEPTLVEQYAPTWAGGLPQGQLDAAKAAPPSVMQGGTVAAWDGRGYYSYALQSGGAIKIAAAPQAAGVQGTYVTSTSNNRAYVAILEEYMTDQGAVNPNSDMTIAIQVALAAAKPLLPTVYQPSTAGDVATSTPPRDWNKIAWIVGGLALFATAAGGTGYWYYRRNKT